MTKYAYNVLLLVPEKTDVDMFQEFSNIIKWSADNKLTVNLAKTKKIVFHRPNPRNYLRPAELDGIGRVAKLLEVWLQNGCGKTSRIHNAYVQPTVVFAESNEEARFTTSVVA